MRKIATGTLLTIITKLQGFPDNTEHTFMAVSFSVEKLLGREGGQLPV